MFVLNIMDWWYEETQAILKIWKRKFGSLYHKLSCDEKPQHDECPEGEDSWCSWQKAKATGTLHEHKHKSALPQDVYKALTPVYEELSRDDLLKRCVGSCTQNNESFNSIVWSLAPKSVSSDKVDLDIAATIATCVYNDGLTSIMKIMELLGITIGSNCYNFCQKIEPYQAFGAIADWCSKRLGSSWNQSGKKKRRISI